MPVRKSRLDTQSRTSGRLCRIIATVSRTLAVCAVDAAPARARGEAREVKRESDHREHERGHRQRALQIVGALDLRRDDHGDQQDRQAGGTDRAEADSFARSSGSCVIAAASEP